ncbi:hypothetical protein [Phytoactinopolyspora mesophila]|uniref:Uncharacterized protein n=1 Tax=Phytoactinopolyspora mesophila TaxID=2650750 RepID=A0A7K3M119_9ACTN|nr:hypothetical protein [Phytoactinopolyspora mesophila]NDL56993.1 hypothetical protein [Phytoactinopolyspora mesophila]
MTLPSLIGGPTTQQVGYFAYDSRRLADWIREGLGGDWVLATPTWRSLEDAVSSLVPAPVLFRYACVAVDGWTLVLNNGPLGTDVGVLPSYAARELGCRAIRAVRVEDDAAYPARILEVYGPSGEPPLALERSIAAADDGGRWVFELGGTPFPFEDQSAYQRRSKASRFTSEMVTDYLRALGVPADAEPDWSTAVTVERR